MTAARARSLASRRPLRWRLTVTYAGLVLLAGAVMLAVTYGLVARDGPSTPKSPAVARNLQAFKKLCAGSVKGVTPDPNVVAKCRQGFRGAAVAGAASQRSVDLGHLLFYSLLALGVVALLSAAAGWLIAGRALRPVQAITEAARRASELNLSERLGLSGPADELKELADTFDAMLARLDNAFGSQQRFVANASHELRTPLTLIRTSIDVTLAKPDRTPAQLEQMAAEVGRAADSAEALIEALLTLARSEAAAGPFEPLDLSVLAEDAVEVASRPISARDLRTLTGFGQAPVSGDRILLERLVGNLVDNAVRHNVTGGWLEVRTGITDGSAFLAVSNSGAQVPPGGEESLFEPFHRASGRTAGSLGHGLGLSIARSVAAAHHGIISARPRDHGGLDVTVVLPAAAADPPLPASWA